MSKLLTFLFCLLGVTAVAQLPPVLRNRITTNNWLIDYGTNTTEKVYNVMAFGATNDGITLTGCFATNGNRRITCPTASFVANDAGKIFKLAFAGTNGVMDWADGISNVVSSTVIELTNAPVYNATNEPAVYGRDNQAAFLAAFRLYNGTENIKILVPEGIYCFAPNISDAGAISNHYNAQLFLPSIVEIGGRAPSFELCGIGSFGGQVVTPSQHRYEARGSVLWSFRMRGPDGLNYESFITFASTNSGSPLTGIGTTFGRRYNHVKPIIRNMKIKTSFNANLYAVDAVSGPSSHLLDTLIDGGFHHMDIDINNPFPVLTGTNGVGYSAPQHFNDSDNVIINSTIDHFYNGVILGENMIVTGLKIKACHNAFATRVGGGTFSELHDVQIQETAVGFYLENAISSINLNGSFACYAYGFAFAAFTNIIDPGSSLSGELRFYQQGDASSINTNTGNAVLHAVSPVRIKLLSNVSDIRYGPQITTAEYFNTNAFFRGNITMRNGGRFRQIGSEKWHSLQLGGDELSATTITANTAKDFSIGMPRYQDAGIYPDVASPLTIIHARAFNSGLTRLNLGFDDYGAFGATEINLGLGADTTSAAEAWLTLNNSGQFYPSKPIDLATTSRGFDDLYVTNINVMNVTTNTTSAAAVGEMSIVVGGHTYKIQLRR